MNDLQANISVYCAAESAKDNPVDLLFLSISDPAINMQTQDIETFRGSGFFFSLFSHSGSGIFAPAFAWIINMKTALNWLKARQVVLSETNAEPEWFLQLFKYLEYLCITCSLTLNIKALYEINE